jgi:hypothetical protein
MSNQITVYIPYIRNNITRSILAYYFRNENIGEIVNANLYSKMIGGEIYYIGVVKVNLYDSNRAREFYTKLNLEQTFKFIYDEEAGFSWLIKLYNPYMLTQKNNDDILPVNSSNIPLDYVHGSQFMMDEHQPMNISIKFKDYLYDTISFENMMREINTTIQNYSHELYQI